ncbi:MAG: hypothetical protein GY821_09265 [Gammaproteobacteria bacterium]|nr:hypothetical protein [Gammaproteobacteria bacterium]
MKIKEAFNDRKIPENCLSTEKLSDDEESEAFEFLKSGLDDITCDMLESCHDVIYWLSPRAFCYFLPGIITASIRENRPELIVVDSIVQMLDRSPEPAYWDDFFRERWLLLSETECEAIQSWLSWLSGFENLFFDPNSLSRAINTLNFVKHGIKPIR